MAMPITHHRFTVDEYYRMAEAGVLTEHDRVELIDGQVVEMSPIGPRHAGRVDRISRVFYRLVGDSVMLRVQNPVVLDPHQALQPDVAVLRPRKHEYLESHPGPDDILLVIEVADTTIDYDRSVKLPLYARAGVPELWIMNLPSDRIEVYGNPVGSEYTSFRIAVRGATLTPKMLPAISIRADEIL